MMRNVFKILYWQDVKGFGPVSLVEHTRASQQTNEITIHWFRTISKKSGRVRHLPFRNSSDCLFEYASMPVICSVVTVMTFSRALLSVSVGFVIFDKNFNVLNECISSALYIDRNALLENVWRDSDQE